ncbi:indolepyruvate ferredoxin oxidoreductase subunit alpha [Desulfoprunum benzoelyticum]|uniref:Indolepyruvate oxidoreductase subunit IorA n=1 Tax=Desulfoprunum benzoelyticum TaxID=1506996 RepID=A0A840UUD7_9BACT|nr:indolepyruvate ferredoxin oxidoreductase subunit alpha [Desulfoprunum benzoelyticum]MBB5349402.1 indolepyruvate ferredoxin oxidoreductase alpha subunit [Desulfoprunum benzoelyticum]MBM9531186.1 indolepyruvate ferredoxin oxidoreductase subunit alpha [Desulfoprunum benzoelyticum]
MHKLLSDQRDKKMLLLGNEAIARGAIEAGLAIGATYPGTPSSEISAALFEISHQSDLYFEYSTNEKVALEVAAAAANCGLRSMAIMKHVGLNVAADALMTLAYVGVKGGMVILSADDPFMFSSQNEQDNRYYGKLSGLPVLEPSSVDEAKEMIKYAFELSEKLQEPVLFRTTTRINHSSGIVTLGDIAPVNSSGDFVKDPFSYVTVPAVSRNLHVKLLKHWDEAKSISENSPYNLIEGDGPCGIVCNGISYNYVSDAVKDLGCEEKVKILKIGFSNPMPESTVKNFLKGCEKVLVVEEGEPYMEETVKAFAQEEGSTIPIKGKSPSHFSRLYEYSPALVRKVIAEYLDLAYQPPAIPDMSDVPEIPQRPPNLCAGCSHRATFYIAKQAAAGMETIIPTDIGCYTLGLLPPMSMADFVICMGSSVTTSCGFSKATNKKVISFIGDSTFFHSGIPGLINAVFNNHNFTLFILDNGTTAMTGHQPNPGVDMTLLNQTGFGRVDIEDVVRAVGVKEVTVIQPFKLKKSIEAVKKAFEFKGVSVVISREMCTLYAKSLKLQKGKRYRVSDKCKNHRDCINQLGCPAFFLNEGRVQINPAQCTGCAVCVQVCPENAILPIKE